MSLLQAKSSESPPRVRQHFVSRLSLLSAAFVLFTFNTWRAAGYLFALKSASNCWALANHWLGSWQYFGSLLAVYWQSIGSFTLPLITGHWSLVTGYWLLNTWLITWF